MAWLVENGARPTTQRIRGYLESLPDVKKAGSYNRMGQMIKRFCNRHLETADWVSHIPALGLEKEKPTRAMPPHMVDALTRHVRARIDGLRPAPNTRYAEEAPVEIAKYLGKYHR